MDIFQQIHQLRFIMRLYSYEKLDVWQSSRSLNKSIYTLTELFPPSEKYGLTSQLRRASISISSNLAEGSSRISPKEQARFTEMAFSSLMEVLNHLQLSVDLEFINRNTFEDLRPEIEQIGNKLNALRSSQLQRHKQINR